MNIEWKVEAVATVGTRKNAAPSTEVVATASVGVTKVERKA